MSFVLVDLTLPSGDTVAEAFGKINDGFISTLREITLGGVPGWNLAVAGADLSAPDSVTWTSGTNKVKIAYTYSGGNVATAVHQYSTNSGTDWTITGTETFAYDGSGYCTGSTWS